MHIDTTIPPSGDRVGALLSIASYLDSDELGAAIDALIERMDTAAGDSDGEDDDPAGGDIVDAPHDAEEDFGAEERGEPGSWPEGYQSTSNCIGDDDFDEQTDRAAMKEHRDRIRRTRCTITRHPQSPFGGRLWIEYELPGAFGRARTSFAGELLK